VSKVRVRKLTEEEIEKLPFPETARKIGGVLEIVDDIPEKEIERFRELWYKLFKESKWSNTLGEEKD
jgi:hypothetical protein